MIYISTALGCMQKVAQALSIIKKAVGTAVHLSRSPVASLWTQTAFKILIFFLHNPLHHILVEQLHHKLSLVLHIKYVIHI